MPHADKATSILSKPKQKHLPGRDKASWGLQKSALELGTSLLQLSQQLRKLEAEQWAPHEEPWPALSLMSHLSLH